MVILDHSSVRDPIDANDVEPFHASLGGDCKKVFRIGLGTAASGRLPSAPSPNGRPKWMFECGVSGIKCLEMLQWIVDVDKSAESAVTCPLPDIESCRTLMARALEIESLDSLPYQSLDDSWKFTVALDELMGAQSTPELYDCLLRLGADFSVYDHDVAKVLEHPFLPRKDLAGATMIHRLREVCDDLRSSLLSRVTRPRPEEPNKILIIDDKPDDLDGVLSLLQSSLLPGFEVLVWNPIAAEQNRAFERLCAYRSLDYQGMADLTIRLRPLSPGAANGGEFTVSLMEILPQLQFIVVDQLYRSGKQFGFHGRDLIRGLGRVVRDQRPEVQRIPEIIALSRTRSPDAVNRALQAGARDYVAKANLVALPGVLARIQRTVSEPATSLHRNFSRLYDLPNEIIGWLRAVRIPPVGLEEEIQANETIQSIQIVRTMLGAIPKTDLHLHVGSCMSTEFLVVASLIGLLQEEKPKSDHGRLVACLSEVIEASPVAFRVDLDEGKMGFDVAFTGGRDWISSLSKEAQKGLIRQAKELSKVRREREDAYRSLRSILHKELKISDYKSDAEILATLRSERDNLKLAWFAVRHRHGIVKPLELDQETFVRLYILVLAANKYGGARLEVGTGARRRDVLGWFRRGENWPTSSNGTLWANIRKNFYEEGERGKESKSAGSYTVERFRSGGWRPPSSPRKLPAIRLSLPETTSFSFDTAAIEWTVGTGTRSGSLSEYLEGCEFSGSTHLKHPFLIHLYAQHLMQHFVRMGLLYVELRGSPDGYVNRKIDFGFADACDCTIAALSLAQETVVAAYREQKQPNVTWLPEIFAGAGSPHEQRSSLWSLDGLQAELRPNQEAVKRRFPVKMSFILVGKRHKAATDIMIEAAAGAVLHQVDSRFPAMQAPEFLEECRKCRVVGFDLAGNEADFPPGLFAREFQRLAKLKVPLTVHAGENASSRFVEDAILELGARRIGHALTLADDKKLMTLVREQRICVELCPVSNHQTCHFTPEEQPGRTYPLKEFLHAGIPVCINTDNPIISRTDIVKEYFRASKAMGEQGLSLWDALILVKTGFRHAFLSLPVRKAMLEIVDQIVFDLFCDLSVQANLRELVKIQADNSRA